MPVIAEWTAPLPTLPTDQMREVDRAMMQDIGITLMQMMENAGQHLERRPSEMKRRDRWSILI